MNWFNWHKHSWKEIARTYAAYNPEVIPFTEGEVQGLTTILWECEICKKLRKTEMLGALVESK